MTSSNSIKLANKDLLLAIFVMFLWGANFSFIKLGLLELDSLVLAALRFLLCAVPLVFFVKYPKVDYKIVLSYSFLFGFGLWGISNYAIQTGVPAGIASLILQFSPLFTIILSFFIFKTNLNIKQLVGIGISILGLIFLIMYRSNNISILNIFYLLISAFSWSICNILVKKYQPENMFSFVIWTSLYSSLILFVMVIFKDYRLIIDIKNHINFNTIISLISQAYVTTLFGYWAWNMLINKYSPNVVSPMSLLVPVFSIAISYAVFNDNISFFTALSCLIILIGLFVFVLNKEHLRNFFSIKS